jgi:pimeloyl-ACP methyl ester carboxylesterase
MTETPGRLVERDAASGPGAARILTRGDGATIAYHRHEGKTPGVMFLGGFMSDMTGLKATSLEDHCRARGRAFVRFDYLGHGQSSGAFADGTIGRWAQDAVCVLDELTDGPQLLVGSSMGGWIMLLAALARPDRVAGLVGIAAAPDFTETLIWHRMSADARAALQRDGVWHEPSRYSATPYAITRTLIEDGRKHLLLEQPIAVHCPVTLVHGMEDRDVPWQHAMLIAERLLSRHVAVTLVKDGDHRLSRPEDIARLCRIVDGMCAAIG